MSQTYIIAEPGKVQPELFHVTCVTDELRQAEVWERTAPDGAVVFVSTRPFCEMADLAFRSFPVEQLQTLAGPDAAIIKRSA